MRFSTKKFSPLAHSLYGSIIKGLMIQNISLNKPLLSLISPMSIKRAIDFLALSIFIDVIMKMERIW